MESDERLMQRYREGNEEAFLDLYKKYSPMVYGYVRKRLRESEAEDFYQKVWRQLHEKKELYQQQPFAPWFFVLIRNLLVDEYRVLGRRPEEWKLEQDTSSLEKIEELLSDLPAPTASLVRKYYLEGFTYEDLEKETGLSQLNLRQRISRAVRSLKVMGIR